MKKERRYNEEEIAAIFEQAASDHKKAKQGVGRDSGLTLGELEQIGADTGIDPEFIARAAARLDYNYQVQEEKTLAGLPLQVNRIVDLPGSFSDADWDRLVVDLHDTFQVAGAMNSESGSRIRSWTNGYVQVYVEPLGEGYRLRINSSNDMDVIFMMTGVIFFFVSLVFMGILMTKGRFMTEMDDTLIMFILSAIGLVSGGVGAFKLPRWHRNEAAKIDGIVDRVLQNSSMAGNVGVEESAEEYEAASTETTEGEARIELEDAGEEHQPETDQAGQPASRSRSNAR